MTRPGQLRPDEDVGLKQVRAGCPELDAAVNHVRAFGSLMREHRGKDLDEWIEQVRENDLQALRQFADGLLHDRDAVVAGLSSTWSSGQVEGQVTRVKLLKRSASAGPTSISSARAYSSGLETGKDLPVHWRRWE